MGLEKKAVDKTYQVRITDNASQNIDEITEYVAFVNHQPLNAAKIGAKISHLFDQININPFAFKECPSLPTKSKMYRQANCYDWQIIFKVIGSEIIILGVVHGSRKRSRVKLLRKIK